MAKWSTKRAEYEQQQALKRAAEYSAAYEARITEIEKLLRWNQWKVERIESDVWKVTMPGAAWMLVRGIEALQRKSIGMR